MAIAIKTIQRLAHSNSTDSNAHNIVASFVLVAALIAFMTAATTTTRYGDESTLELVTERIRGIRRTHFKNPRTIQMRNLFESDFDLNECLLCFTNRYQQHGSEHKPNHYSVSNFKSNITDSSI